MSQTNLSSQMQLVFETLTAETTINFSDQTVAKTLQAGGLRLVYDGFVPAPLPIDVLLLQRKFAGIFLIGSRLSASVDVTDQLRAYLAK